VQLDAHTAIMTLLEFLYISFPFGIATSATIRVGNLLGAGRAHEARVAGDRIDAAPSARSAKLHAWVSSIAFRVGFSRPTPDCLSEHGGEHVYILR
jgi:hypothetical protein